MAAADLVEYVAKSLVDDPEAVKVEVVNGEEGTAVVITFMLLFVVNFVMSAMYFQLVPPKTG